MKTRPEFTLQRAGSKKVKSQKGQKVKLPLARRLMDPVLDYSGKTKAGRSPMDVLRVVAMFFLAMFLMTVVNSAVWGSALTDRVYHCSDSLEFDFLGPGHWVHPSDPEDWIKPGWSIAGLWGLWWAMFLGSLGISTFMAWLVARWNRN